MKEKVLIIDQVHPLITSRLELAGYQVDNLHNKSYDEYAEIISDYTGIVVRSGITLDKEILQKGKRLKFIGRLGAGMENIDVEFAKSLSIACLNSPEGNRDAVGEHAMGMLLMLMNHLKRVDEEVRKLIWKREINRGTEIKGKTVGIIGYGNMGSAFAQRLQGFECNVIAYDKYKTGFGDDFAKEVDYETIFSETDILSLHVPLTDETKYLVNKEYLESFHKDILLINTARGLVVKTADLVEALKNNKVTAAALDVIEYEETSFEMLQGDKLPEPFEYLIKSEKVLLSPHIAGWTHESKVKLAEFLVEKILKLKYNH